MISNEARADRKWGHFPELRKLFEKYPVPMEVYGWSSVSDNMAAWIGRLIEIAATIDANAKELSEECLEPLDLNALSRDLEQLRGEIHSAAREIDRLDTQINTMGEVLHRAYLRRDKLRAHEQAQKRAQGDGV